MHFFFRFHLEIHVSVCKHYANSVDPDQHAEKQCSAASDLGLSRSQNGMNDLRTTDLDVTENEEVEETLL